jgi:hypothetical protein
MKKTLIMAGAALALAASLASAEGVNLSWTDCGLFGAPVTTFTCNTNTGTPFALVASFQSPAPLGTFLGISAQMDFSSNTASLPDWWKHGTGQCRGSAALSVSFDFSTSTFNCADTWSGQAVGGYLYESGFSVPNRARMLIQCAVPLDAPIALDDASQYYAFRASVTRTKSSGTGSCAGCTEPVCIVLNEIQLFQPDELGNNPKVNLPLERNYVTWQASTVPGCPLSTPTRNSSWGQVKSLYR